MPFVDLSWADEITESIQHAYQKIQTIESSLQFPLSTTTKNKIYKHWENWNQQREQSQIQIDQMLSCCDHWEKFLHKDLWALQQKLQRILQFCVNARNVLAAYQSLPSFQTSTPEQSNQNSSSADPYSFNPESKVTKAA